MIDNLLHILLLIAMPPLLLGIIAKTKALFAGRVGPPLLQPYYDLLKLFRKGSVFSRRRRGCSAAGPVVGLVTALLAVLLVPVGRRAGARSVHGRPDPACLPAGPGPVLHRLGGPGHRLAVRGHGGGPRGHLRLPGRAGAVLRACWSLARLSGSLSLSDMLGSGRRLALDHGRRRRWCWCWRAGSSCCWSRTAASRSTIPTPTSS